MLQHALRLIHAADLHLGYAFAGLPATVRYTLKQDESRQMARLVDCCINEKVDALILAGDVFEHDRPEKETVRLLQDALYRLDDAGIYVFISPGNHDPIWPDSVWNDTSWPERTIIFGSETERVELKGKRAAFFGRAFSAKTEKVALIDELRPALNDKQINVLCLHGDVVSDGQITYYNPIRKRLLTIPHLDYAALGHVHKRLQEEPGWPYPQAAYAGTWRGRGFDETGRMGVYLVSLSKHLSTLAVPFPPQVQLIDVGPQLTFIPLDRHPFIKIDVKRKGAGFSAADIASDMDLAAAELDVKKEDALWRITLVGDYGDYRPSINQLLAHLEPDHLYVELRDLSTAPFDPEMEREHSVKGAFLRQSKRALTIDREHELALDLGLSAFDGPIDLERFFRERRP
ncbi:MAG TPA: DNA repair exonuclease [Fastidiosipila sp.]|nr:DNA repair exonuclease [Fastidiosipila sp.]